MNCTWHHRPLPAGYIFAQSWLFLWLRYSVLPSTAVCQLFADSDIDCLNLEWSCIEMAFEFLIQYLGCSFSVTSSIASLFTSNWHFSAELESFFWHSSHTRVISQNLSNQISILTKVGFHSNHQIPNHDLNSALWHLYDCKQRGDDSAYRKAAGQPSMHLHPTVSRSLDPLADGCDLEPILL